MGKKNDKKNVKKSKVMELFFMSRKTVDIGEIKSIIVDNGGMVQLWEAMNVLQIECAEDRTVDFELFSTTFKEPSDIAFVEKHNINSIYLVTLEEIDFIEVITIFRELSERLEGFFCTDSEDFTPVYNTKDMY